METVNHPPHYQGVPEATRPILIVLGVPEELLDRECIDAIEELQFDFCLGNAVKYLWRYGQKNNAAEDLQKARWYIQRKLDKANQLRYRGISKKWDAIVNSWEKAIALIDELANQSR